MFIQSNPSRLDLWYLDSFHHQGCLCIFTGLSYTVMALSSLLSWKHVILQVSEFSSLLRLVYGDRDKNMFNVKKCTRMSSFVPESTEYWMFTSYSLVAWLMPIKYVSQSHHLQQIRMSNKKTNKLCQTMTCSFALTAHIHFPFGQCDVSHRSLLSHHPIGIHQEPTSMHVSSLVTINSVYSL